MLTLTDSSEIASLVGVEREVYVWHDDVGTVVGRAYAQGQRRWIVWRGLGTFTFVLGSTCVVVRRADGAELAVVSDIFDRVLQPIVLQALGHQSLHASAVVGRAGVLAFCGVSHSGKSTLAYALACNGYRQIADDAVVVEPTADGVYARPLPFIAGLRPPARRHFGDTGPPLDCGVNANSPPAGRLPLRIIFALQQDASVERPTFRRIPPVQAFTTVVTHARCFDDADPDNTRQLVNDYLLVADRVPVYETRYAPRFDQLRDVVDGINRLARQSAVTPLTGSDAAERP